MRFDGLSVVYNSTPYLVMQVILPFLFGFTVRKHIYLTITTVYTNYLEINALLLFGFETIQKCLV